MRDLIFTPHVGHGFKIEEDKCMLMHEHQGHFEDVSLNILMIAGRGEMGLSKLR